VTRTTAVTGAATPATEEAVEALRDRIVADLHRTISALRCAGTGRLVRAGVSMTHLHVLWMLQHHGDMPMSRIADLLDVSLSSATGIIDRMEERGLVERVRVPDDRRLVLVRPAADGLRALDDVETVKHDRLRAVLGRLDARQLERLARSFDDVAAALVAEGLPLDTDHVHHFDSMPAASTRAWTRETDPRPGGPL
jgi:DNA-binding MarR family transcriptional regulator